MRKFRFFTVLMLLGILSGCGAKPVENPVQMIATDPTEEHVTETSAPAETTAKSGTESLLESMSLDEKIHQLFIITPEALTGMGQVTACGDTSRAAMDAHPVGGLIYFSDNLETLEQTQEMLANTQEYMCRNSIGMFLAVDEEGGLVARCANNIGTTKLSPMQTYGARNDRDEAYEIGQTLGNDLQFVGFNLDFAPVADVNIDPGNELGGRIFSDDPEVVANMVSGVTEGIQSTGVAAALKHFPGLGAENGNAHDDDKIIIDRTLDELRETEFVPFVSGMEAGADFVMVSHQIVTGAGDDLPSCLSPVICTDILREELGFDGLIVTDSFQMNTISGSYSSGEAAVLAIQAGVDIVLMPQDFEAALGGVREAVEDGRISEERINESVSRILREKEKLGLVS